MKLSEIVLKMESLQGRAISLSQNKLEIHFPNSRSCAQFMQWLDDNWATATTPSDSQLNVEVYI